MKGDTSEGSEPYQRTDLIYGRGGDIVSLPYATPQVIQHRLGGNRHTPPTAGAVMVIPQAYTVVDTKTLGSSATMRMRTPGRTQEP